MSKFALEDYLHPIKNTYRTSPQWFKDSIGWAYSKLPMGIRYGPELRKARSFLAVSQGWSRDQLLDYQWRQFRLLLDHAYANVPFYHATWSALGVTPADIRSWADVAILPLLTKDQVRAHREELVARNYRDRLLTANTGGSTGQPLEFYWERGRTRALERAFMWRQWQWAGFTYGQRTAVIRGQTVSGGLAHYDPIDRHLFLSGFSLSDATAAEYLAKLREYRPISIQAYPSTITLLAGFMKRHDEPPIAGLKVILAGSENLYPSQRSLVEEVFGCRVYSWYGHGESVCLAGGCEQSDLYHVYSEYGYAELVDPEGRVLPWTPGVRGEIVGTGFNNWAMPLIRYRTGDIAIAGPAECECGRHYPLWERIEGRLQDYIVSSSGQMISVTAFAFGQHYHAFQKIERMQLVQNEPGAVIVRLVPTSGWTDADEEELIHDMHRALGGGWKIEVQRVDHIELTQRGKQRFVLQNVAAPDALNWAGERTP